MLINQYDISMNFLFKIFNFQEKLYLLIEKLVTLRPSYLMSAIVRNYSDFPKKGYVDREVLMQFVGRLFRSMSFGDAFQDKENKFVGLMPMFFMSLVCLNKDLRLILKTILSLSLSLCLLSLPTYTINKGCFKA